MQNAATRPRSRVISTIVDLLRGALIGIVEIIPGVSGGTIALIIGVYETLISSAGHLVRGVVRSIIDGVARRGQLRAREHFAQVQWRVLVPVGVGMLAAIVGGAKVLAPLIENHPEVAKALFAGLILTSLIVPIRMVGGRWRAQEYAFAALAAVIGFGLSSLPTADPVDPPLILVAVAAAIAVCALVLPGVSGSFLLLIVGMYAPTLDAVNDRDFVYLGVFILGAIIGLGLFVNVLQWLLEHRRRITLAIMTGLMVGSLRALWPWQTEDGQLEPVGDQMVPSIIAFVVGIVVVSILLAVESAMVRRRLASGADSLHPEPHPERG